MAARQKGKEEVSHGEKTLLNPSFHNDLEDILKRLGASKPSSDVIAPLPR